MKNWFTYVLSGVVAAAVLVPAGWAADKERTNLIIGVAPGPYGDLTAKAIKPGLEKKGYKVDIKEFSDWVTPNLALAGKDIDINLFQHSVYLSKFAADKGLQLSPGISIPTAGLGLFSNKIKKVEDIRDGAEFTLPNDPTNLARSLRFLASLKLITLKADIDPAKASERDIADNPKHLKLVPVEAAQIPRTLDSVDFAVISGNYAIASGLKLSSALALEKLSEPYKIVVAVRTEDRGREFVRDISDVITSEAFKDIVEEPSNNFKEFQKPQWYLTKWNLKQ